MDTKQQGNLGEAKVAMFLIELGYFVYKPLFNDGPIDLVVMDKEGKLLRVEVKATSKGKKDYYNVQLRSVRSNRTKNVIHHFNTAASDLLAIYLVDDDTVIIKESKTITAKNSIRIKLED